MFKSNIKVLLAKKRMSQNSFSEKTGISKRRIKELKDGSCKFVKIKELEIICEEFDCTLNDIYEHIKD